MPTQPMDVTPQLARRSREPKRKPRPTPYDHVPGARRPVPPPETPQLLAPETPQLAQPIDPERETPVPQQVVINTRPRWIQGVLDDETPFPEPVSVYAAKPQGVIDETPVPQAVPNAKAKTKAVPKAKDKAVPKAKAKAVPKAKAKARIRRGVPQDEPETPVPEPKQPRRRFKRSVLTDAQETPVPKPVSAYKAKPRFRKGVLDETPVPETVSI